MISVKCDLNKYDNMLLFWIGDGSKGIVAHIYTDESIDDLKYLEDEIIDKINRVR